MTMPFPITVLFVGGVLLVTAVVIVLLVWLPKYQVVGVADLPARLALENEARKTLAQILGGIAFLAGLYFSAENLRLTSERQIGERFADAIKNLGSESVAARVSAVYELEQIARESEPDYQAVYEILTADVRTRAAWREELRQKARRPDEDVQAILTVIGRRQKVYGNGEATRLNLSGVDLRHADLEGANLQGVNFSGTYLYPANLRGADLTNSLMRQTYLMGADLEGAILRGADLWRIDAENAILKDACFEGAALSDGRLHGADLSDASGLSEAEYAHAFHDEKTKPPGSWRDKCN